MAGRIRGVSCNRRSMLVDWQVAAAAPAAPGSFGDPAEAERLAWRAARAPGTAAEAIGWTWDDRRAFDAEDWWWRARLPDGDGPRVLGFDGIATLADVWIDGAHVLASDNMFRAHALPIAGGRELVIRCRALEPELAKKRPRPRWRVPMLEHQQLRWIRTTLLGRTPGWSPPCPAVGPWRPVWLEERVLRVGDVAIVTRPDGTVAVDADIDASDVVLVVTRDGERITGALAQRDGRWRGEARVRAPALWWPHTHGEPARYHATLEVTVKTERAVIDLGAIGFRAIELDRGSGDDFAIRVNGVRVFCRGACWTPLDAITLRATPERYQAAVAQVAAAGMNMIRIGGTMVYEDDALYDALDAAGVLLWQDLMFANMDYPDELDVDAELDQQLARLQARPALAVVCGNSEGQQQAAMSSAPPERWAPALFHERIPRLVRARLGDVPYTPSSTDRGAFPHQPSAGCSSYYGVGAYLRPLDDARRAEVKFASECLAFANVPAESGLPGGPALRVHHPAWKARSPRDLGAGWDFDDVRDHYVRDLFAVDPVTLRVADHDRYLALGRATTGEVMARTFAEWRRARSTCAGGLIWFLRDLWPGAGWGVVDARGAPKPAWYALRRALAPIAIAITDEGCNGLAIHAVNDRPEPLAAQLEVTLVRNGSVEVGRATRDLVVPGHGAIELAAAALFDGFFDLSFAYRFGPPTAHVVRAVLHANAAIAAEAFHFPAGPPAREADVGLAAKLDGTSLQVSAQRFAHGVWIEVPGCVPDDNNFCLAPGQTRTIALAGALGRGSGSVTALNAEVSARVEAAR